MTLSQDTANAAAPGETIRDKTVPGLQLRAFPGRKSFYLYYRFKGQERKPKIGDYPTLSITAARRIAKEMLEKVAAGSDPSAERQADREAPTVRELCKRYMDKHGSKKKTRVEDQRRIDKYINPKLGPKKVADLKTTDIEDLHDSLSNKPYQANRVRAQLSKMLNLAEKWEMRPLGSNPCKHIGRYKENKRKRYMDRDEAGAIVERLRFYEGPYPQQAAFLWLLIYTGARPKEIASLRGEHLVGSKIVLKEHKTAESTGEDRVIQLPPQAVALLEKLHHGEDETLLGIKSPRHLWLKIVKDTGIKGLRPYDMRHTFASIGLSNGKSLAQIGELLGHKSTETTKRYAHLIDEKAKEDAEDIADAFDAFARPKLKVVK